MKKRFFAFVLALVLVIIALSAPVSASAGLENFQKTREYEDGQFSDVPADAWYAGNVKNAYEIGLVNGTGSGYNPAGNITLAETIVLADRIHSIYHDNGETFEMGDPWYQVYVDYAVENSIIQGGAYSDYSIPSTRTQFVAILAAALPAAELSEINTITDGQIPDVTNVDGDNAKIYMFYRAGILAGNDAYGTFAPDTNIQRSAVAAIVNRIVDVNQRLSVNLKSTAVTAIKLPQALTLKFGSNLITPEIEPFDALDKNLTWTSSNPSIIKVYKTQDASTYNISCVGAGTATITATSSNGVSASIKVTVAFDDDVLAKYAYQRLVQSVKFPSTLKVYDIWAWETGFSSTYHKIEIEYSAENNFGQSVRSFYIVSFDESGTIAQTKSSSSSPRYDSGFLGSNARRIGTNGIV